MTTTTTRRRRSSKQELASVHRFAQAGVSMGKVHEAAAFDEFERTGESGYQEGWAAGYSAAFKLMVDFIEFDEKKRV